MVFYERGEYSLVTVVVFALLAFGRSSDLAAQVTAESASREASPSQVAANDPCAATGEPTAIGWKLAKMTLQATLLRATQSQQAYQTEVLSLRDRPPCDSRHQRTMFNLLAGYDSKQQKGKSGSTVNRNGDLRLQHLIFGRDDTRYLSVNADSYHNSSLGVYFQQAFGVGGGRFVKATEFDADIRVIHQRFYKRKADDLIGTQLSLRRSFTLGAAVVTTTLQGTPMFNKPDAWQARGILGVAAPLSKTFSLVVTGFDDYINNVPANYRKNYLKAVFGVQFSPSAK
jgi:hypothetical protein